MPARTVGSEVFVHVPEAHVISGIDAEIAIIAPARAVRLRAGSIEHVRFALAKIAGRITGKTASIADTREAGAARDRIPNGRITRVINGHTRHKPIQTIPAVGPRLLLDGRSREIAPGYIELVPPNTCWLGAVCVLTNSVIRPQRFCPALVEISERRHDFVAQGLDSIGSALLRHDRKTVRSGECVNKWIDRNQRIRAVIGTDTHGWVSGRGKIDVKFPRFHLGFYHATCSRAINSQKHFVSARRWRGAGTKVGGH